MKSRLRILFERLRKEKKVLPARFSTELIHPVPTEPSVLPTACSLSNPVKEPIKECLYVCNRCGSHFMSSSFPESCPSCHRSVSDRVTDLDTGETWGGTPILREATMKETAAWNLRRKGPAHDATKNNGKMIVVIVGRGENN